MAYDEDLASRIRASLGARTTFDEIKMFGGLCFTVNGDMALGVVKDELMVRVGAPANAHALSKPGARPMEFTGKPMEGFVFVGGQGIGTKRALGAWTTIALTFNATLPPKAKKPKRSTAL